MGDDYVVTVTAALETAHDDRVLALLNDCAAEVIGNDLVHRFLPHVERLATLNYERHPRAALVAGAALCGYDRTLGRGLITAARVASVVSGDELAVGLGCFVEGLEELSEGRTSNARALLLEARPILEEYNANRMIVGHQALTKFIDGDVEGAGVLAEHALWGAQAARDRRSEVICHVVLCMVHLVSGRFSAVERSLSMGFAAEAALPETDRYEHPMLLLGRATLGSYRHDPLHEADHQAAIQASLAQCNDWYASIARASRTLERTARADPTRAICDAEVALKYFSDVGETWWSRSARLAYAVADSEMGNDWAAQRICADLIDEDLTPFDRGRVLLALAGVSHRLGDGNAHKHASGAVESFRTIGANYWQALAEMKLAVVDSRHAEFHRRRAHALVPPGEQSDAAWRNVLRGEGSILVRVLGDRHVSVDGRPVAFETRNEFELVAMLSVHPTGIDRHVVAERLWPDDDDQRVDHRMHNLISAVRKRLSPTSRITQYHGRIVMEFLLGECDVVDVVDAAQKELRKPELSHEDRLVLAERLKPRLLDGAAVPWVSLEQAHLDGMAERLRR